MFGKVTIINSLFLSQLIYRFTVLPTPSKSIIDKIDKILFNYLWENRPHKIAKDVVSNEYQSGGIKMPNIYIKNDALKCSSVDRIYKNPSYILCPTLDLYCYIETTELLKCNLAPWDIHHTGVNNHPSSGWMYLQPGADSISNQLMRAQTSRHKWFGLTQI